MLVGVYHRYLMPNSTVIGALILTLADTVGRTVIALTMIPMGIMTSIIGVLLLVYLLIRREDIVIEVRVKDVKLYYESIKALDDVSFNVKSGEKYYQ